MCVYVCVSVCICYEFVVDMNYSFVSHVTSLGAVSYPKNQHILALYLLSKVLHNYELIWIIVVVLWNVCVHINCSALIPLCCIELTQPNFIKFNPPTTTFSNACALCAECVL